MNLKNFETYILELEIFKKIIEIMKYELIKLIK